MKFFFKTSSINTDTEIISQVFTDYLVNALYYVITDPFPLNPAYQRPLNDQF